MIYWSEIFDNINVFIQRPRRYFDFSLVMWSLAHLLKSSRLCTVGYLQGCQPPDGAKRSLTFTCNLQMTKTSSFGENYCFGDKEKTLPTLFVTFCYLIL